MKTEKRGELQEVLKPYTEQVNFSIIFSTSLFHRRKKHVHVFTYNKILVSNELIYFHC